MVREKVVYDSITYNSKKEFAHKNDIPYDRLMYFINKKRSFI